VIHFFSKTEESINSKSDVALPSMSQVIILEEPPSESYKYKISQNPLELGNTAEIILGVIEELVIIQALIEYEGTNHTMKVGGVNLWAYNWTPVSTGSYPFTIHMENKSSSWYGFSDVLKVVIDATPPDFKTIDGEVKEVEPGKTVKISMSIKDSYGIKQVLIEFEGLNYSMTNILGTDIWQFELTAPDTIGVYTYKIYMEDNNNNWNTTTGSFQVLDSSAIDKFISSLLWWLPIVVFILGLMIGAITVSKLIKKSNGRKRECKLIADTIPEKYKKRSKIIQVECPICKTIKRIFIPKSLFGEFKGIKTLSIPRNLMCEHPFQIFIDNFFDIRGVQTVDFELKISDNDKIDKK
jgi:hypothetical protein